MPTSGVTDLAGRVLAGRYRLLAPIGAGASGRVYLAQDVRLRRRVAVKVLHAALAEDAGFLKRFRSEAQIAASLNHRNIMTVHDWGEDELPFMVMEHLEGGSLRSMLDRGVRLTATQTAHLGLEVAAALEYAHARGLVHRDIKPANLLFDGHGIVRVADFGLARALAEASWTEPAGAVLGTVRYVAPEQAAGRPLDGRADLYSLALVLVEAVTGEVPNTGETAVATLGIRAARPIPASGELGPLGAVVERAGRPDPSERYQDAKTMGAALFDVSRRLPPPAPLPLHGGEFGDDPHPTEVKVSDAVVIDDSTPYVLPDARPLARVDARRAIPVIVSALVVLALAFAAFAIAQASGRRVVAPNVSGRSEDQARAAADRAGLHVVVDTRRRSDEPAGIVLEQRPEPGTWARRGGRVHVVLSDGPPPVPVPAVLGQLADQAEQALRGADFDVVVNHAFDEQVAKGNVVAQDPPANGQAPRGSTITLVVSDGPKPVPVPSVVGQPVDAATKAIKDARLTANRVDDFSDTVPQNQVISQDPPAGQEVPPGTKVTIHVSKGQELIEVPDVRGMAVEDAATKLQDLGFTVDIVNFKRGRPVKDQDPPGGTKLKRGASVQIIVARG